MSATVDGIRILHVDDEPNFAEIAGTFLERENDRFDIETAASASEALDRLDGTVDCVVSDYDMPRESGLELLDTVRESRPNLPFILFTGKGSEEIASQAISAGVTDYLQKEGGTGQYTVLANRIENAVSQHRSQRELEASQRRLSLFVDQSPLGVIEYNSEFEIVGLNPAGEEILGYTEADLQGETWEKLVAKTSYENVDEVTSALAEVEGGYHSIDENVRKDGEHIVCEWHNRVVTDDSVEHSATDNRTESGDSEGSSIPRADSEERSSSGSEEHSSSGSRTQSGDSEGHGPSGSRPEADDNRPQAGDAVPVSSSLPENPMDLKREVVDAAFEASDLAPGDAAYHPELAVRFLGDPVLATVAGLTAGALESGTGVTLGGGTQMLAAAALVRHAGVAEPLSVAATTYVAADADLGAAAAALDCDLVVTDPGFEGRDDPLARYAAGEAKEGAGMGGALLLAERAGALGRVADGTLEVVERLTESHGP